MTDFDKNSGTAAADAGTPDTAQSGGVKKQEAHSQENKTGDKASTPVTPSENGQKQAETHAVATSSKTGNTLEKSGKKEGKPQKASDSLTAELGKAKKDAADYLDALQHERADFINYRHRMVHEKDDYRHMGQEDVLKALLPALDNLDRLREHGKMTKEVDAVAKQLDRGFSRFHITKFGTKGEAFDPARHEAILHRTSPDVDSVQVDTVVESGYELGDKILRAAKVVVVSPQEKKTSATEPKVHQASKAAPAAKPANSSDTHPPQENPAAAQKAKPTAK